MVIGFITRRGHYLADDLQIFNRGGRGGHYWFTRGWNLRAMGAWLPAALLGLSFVNLPGQFVGPLGTLAGGLDLSVPVSLLVGGAIYVALLMMFPEPEAVYGREGRRFVRGSRVHAVVSVHAPRMREERSATAVRALQREPEYAE